MNLWLWIAFGGVPVTALVAFRRRRAAGWMFGARYRSLAKLTAELTKLENGRPLTCELDMQIGNALEIFHSDATVPEAEAAVRRYKEICKLAGHCEHSVSFLLIRMLARVCRFGEAEEIVRADLLSPPDRIGVQRADPDLMFNGEDGKKLYRAQMLELLAAIVYHQDRYHEALEILEEAAALIRSVHPAEGLLRENNEGRAWCLFRLGRCREARELARSTFASTAHPIHKIHILDFLFESAVSMGDVVEADRWLQEMEKNDHERGWARATHLGLVVRRSKLCRLKGQNEEADRLQADALHRGFRGDLLESVDDFRRW